MSNLSGARLGRYALLVPIGSGGMGQVWIAQHTGELAFRRIVAVKLIRTDHASDVDFRRMFLNEARVAARVSHANVVEVVDLGEEGHQLYQVMEYVEGDSLAQLLRRAQQTPDPHAPISVVCRIVVDALRGLHAAHEATDEQGAPLGFIHRDVSPHNVLVGLDGVARIADFGIAKLLAELTPETQTGHVKGKPGYMSPEQASALPLDRRSDVYAMGIVAWEAVTGRRLAAKGPTALSPLVPLDVPNASLIRPDLAADVASVIAKALEGAAALRFATAEAMADALEQTGACATTKEAGDWVKHLAGESLAAKRNEARRVAARLEARSSEPPDPDSLQQTRRESLVADASTGVTRSLAVLPFRYRGPAEDDYLGEAFGEELIDLLSRTPGLRVFAGGAMARFRENRDPTTVGTALGADAIVDGSIQRTGAKVRVGVRLIDAKSGVQLWSETSTSSLEEVLTLQESMSRRIAETLRVELSMRSTGSVAAVPPEAIELLLRARRRLRAIRVIGPDNALDLLARCLALAPGLPPALAAYAIASVRAWFHPNVSVSGGTEALAREAVANALSGAPDLPESHFAAALFALHVGESREAVARLGTALELAPNYPEALTTLGTIECETGLGERGRPRLELAFELGPDIINAYALAYHHAIHGRYEEFESVLDRSHDLRDSSGLLVLAMRVASWRGDTERVQAAFDRMMLTQGDRQRFEMHGRALLGHGTDAEVDGHLEGVLASFTNGRTQSLFCQLGVELFALRGNLEYAEKYARRAAEGRLLDLEWLDRCPALAGFRSSSAFGPIRSLVALRVRSLRDG